MSMRIWRLAGVSLLALSISAQVLADENNQQQQRNEQQQRQQQQRGFEQQRQQQQNQQRSFNQDQQQRQQQQQQQQRQQEQLNQQRPIQQNQQQRADQQRQQQDRERNQQRQDQNQQQQRQQQLQQQQRQQQQQLQQRQLQDRQSNLPIQRRPDTVVQTQEPRQGFYRDQPRENNPWRGGDNHAGNNGRPGGHGDGWGGGPRYRPGYEIDRMPGGYSRVPYHGSDYFYSAGYWYRPQGPRYVVVAPPRGVRVRYLPDYAQQVWLGSALFFLAAGTYYTYEQSTQEYVVAEPPQGVEPVYSPQQVQPQPADPYDVIAYPANGQTQQQIEQDRYDCYRYAVQQSNFDPAAATYQPAPEVVGIYRQAMAGCYAGRGYSVQQ